MRMNDSLSARNPSSLTLEKFVRVEAKLKTILATLSCHLLCSFKKICSVVHNSVSKTANQSASFQLLDDHDLNTYAFLANQSAESQSHDTDRRCVQVGFVEMEVTQKRK